MLLETFCNNNSYKYGVTTHNVETIGIFVKIELHIDWRHQIKSKHTIAHSKTNIKIVS